MGRPRRPFNGVEEIQRLETLWMEDVLPGKLGVRQRGRWESSTRWSYRHPNGQFDPLTYLHVLDGVANIDPDIELRSSRFTDWLNRTRTQFIWDPVTVGKVLSDLCDAFEGVLGVKQGLLERGTDYRGRFYRIHRTEEIAKTYHALREDLMRLVEDEMEQRQNRQRPQRLVSPLLECPSVRGEWERADS